MVYIGATGYIFRRLHYHVGPWFPPWVWIESKDRYNKLGRCDPMWTFYVYWTIPKLLGAMRGFRFYDFHPIPLSKFILPKCIYSMVYWTLNYALKIISQKVLILNPTKDNKHIQHTCHMV
jgi:hypothetical protein